MILHSRFEYLNAERRMERITTLYARCFINENLNESRLFRNLLSFFFFLPLVSFLRREEKSFISIIINFILNKNDKYLFIRFRKSS